MKDRKKPEKFWLPHGMPSDDREFAFSSRVFPKASQIKALYKLWHYQSFCYIDDCMTGIYKLMRSEYTEPLNLGQDRLVTINQLADMVAAIAGVRIVKKHVPGPQGVRGRNSDNTRLRQVLGWEPEIPLEEGLTRTYTWIEAQVRAQLEKA